MSGSCSRTMARLLRSILFVLSERVMFQAELPLIHPAFTKCLVRLLKRPQIKQRPHFFPSVTHIAAVSHYSSNFKATS